MPYLAFSKKLKESLTKQNYVEFIREDKSTPTLPLVFSDPAKILTWRIPFGMYTQYPIIRNSLIRNSAEFLGKFKKQALGRSNLRNASKNIRNGQCSDFQS